MTDIRKLFRWLGVGITAVSAMLTFAFGLSMSSNWLMAVIVAGALACATVASAYIWPFVADAAERKAWATALFTALFGILFTGTDITTNFGSISWQRGVNIQRADTQNVRYDDGRQSIGDLEAQVALYEGRLAKLEATEGWSALKPSAAYDGEIAAKDEAIAQEAKRGGCGPICLTLKQERAELVANQATAKAHEDDKAMLAATREGLRKARAKQGTVEKAESAAQMQNASLASFFTLSREPSDDAKHWTDKGVNWLVALFLAFGAVGCNYLGWWGMGTGTRLGAEATGKAHKAADKSDAPTVPQIAPAPLLERMEPSKPLPVAKVMPVPQQSAQEREVHLHVDGNKPEWLQIIQQRLHSGQMKVAGA